MQTRIISANWERKEGKEKEKEGGREREREGGREKERGKRERGRAGEKKMKNSWTLTEEMWIVVRMYSTSLISKKCRLKAQWANTLVPYLKKL